MYQWFCLRELVITVWDWWCITTKEGFESICQMATCCSNSKKKVDSEEAFKGASYKPVHKYFGVGQGPWWVVYLFLFLLSYDEHYAYWRVTFLNFRSLAIELCQLYTMEKDKSFWYLGLRFGLQLPIFSSCYFTESRSWRWWKWGKEIHCSKNNMWAQPDQIPLWAGFLIYWL